MTETTAPTVTIAHQDRSRDDWADSYQWVVLVDGHEYYGNRCQTEAEAQKKAAKVAAKYAKDWAIYPVAKAAAADCDGLVPAEGQTASDFFVGQRVAVWSFNRMRAGIVEKVGKTNVTVAVVVASTGTLARATAKFAHAVALDAAPAPEAPVTITPETTEETTVAEKPAPKPRKAAAKATPAPEAPKPTAAQRKAASGSAIVAALEAAYADVRKANKDLPDVVFITGTGLMGRGAKWGHYWRDRWVDAPVAGAEDAEAEDSAGGSIVITPGRRPEVFIAGERLACGAEDTLETILHEAAHALAVVRKLQDTSKEGRYHNRTFLALAEELGLEFAGETPHPQIGYSSTRLTEETKAKYAKTISKLQAAITTYLDTFKGMTFGSGTGDGSSTTQGGDGRLPVPPKGGKAKSRNYAKAVCGCGRTIRISPRVLAEAPITCGSCGDPFTIEED